MSLLTVHGQGGEIRTEEPAAAFLAVAAGRAWPLEAELSRGCHLLTRHENAFPGPSFLICKMGKALLLCQ